ncbi:unnamed protein product [Pleuronectes platessa]|uniref:Dynein cytoplasmic 1 intermediate chain 1 n=1 Tax=Pleuronectes platessa TaxID=8262 RepID=A0A9N7YZ68_PLEPL|nr:unnamed protein product [Pleuronectes platessa]
MATGSNISSISVRELDRLPSLVCFGSSDMELVWQPARLVLSGLSGVKRSSERPLTLSICFGGRGAAEKRRRVEEEEEDEEMMEAKPGPESEQPDEDDNKENKEGSFPVLRELTEEERQQILHSSEFQSFFDCSIRVMERALAEDSDIFFDYSGRDPEDKEGDSGSGSSLSFSRLFYDEHWSKHRVVTCLDWSPQYPELMVASYNNNEDAPHEPDGVALVWNTKFKKATPEYIFHCQSPVVSVGFARFHPNLVVGGTYSGQIVLWDNRSHRRTPVQRTPLSAAAHTHPVYCINVVGTQNANNLITVSTDGRMCSWSLDMLSQPQETMELVYNKSKPVAVTGMAFPTGDVNNYVVGSEEGTVYTASRHGSKAGICEMFEGHQGPVTGVSCHGAVGTVDFSHLFITSSFDWTVKLWSTKQNKPLYSFEDNADYVYDVMWSPVHPALFAAVDGMGRLDLWNLNNDTEVPTASVTIEGASALNRVRWASGGKEVAVGDSEGTSVDLRYWRGTEKDDDDDDDDDDNHEHLKRPPHDFAITTKAANLPARSPLRSLMVGGLWLGSPSLVSSRSLWSVQTLLVLTSLRPRADHVLAEPPAAPGRAERLQTAWVAAAASVPLPLTPIELGSSERHLEPRRSLSVAHPDDWGRFARTLMEIRANRADGEEEGPMELDS